MCSLLSSKLNHFFLTFKHFLDDRRHLLKIENLEKHLIFLITINSPHVIIKLIKASFPS